jgi:sugar lactone lactonase YvrE
VAGFQNGFAYLRLPEGDVERIGDPEPELPRSRFNDGKVDTQGRFWAGTMDMDLKEPVGWLYRLDGSGSWVRTDGGYPCTNGPAFSPDGTRMYHNDTLSGIVYAFDLSPDGELEGKRVFTQFGKDEGYPDGMTTDSEGFLWIAVWGGSKVCRFAPDGMLERTLELPVSQVTSCTFGGA